MGTTSQSTKSEHGPRENALRLFELPWSYMSCLATEYDTEVYEVASSIQAC